MNLFGKQVKKSTAAAAVLMVAVAAGAAAFAGGGGTQQFGSLATELQDWAQGSLGIVISIAALLVGLSIGVVKQSLMAVVTGIGIAISLYFGPEVIVGPYPDYGLLSDLHGRGVRTIISLLDRHLIYENSLIRREDLYAGQLGIRELNFPMDSSEPPSSPLNAMALHNIRSYLARHPRTVVYIHCYLGKHRVGDVVQMLHGPQAGSAVARAGRGRD